MVPIAEDSIGKGVGHGPKPPCPFINPLREILHGPSPQLSCLSPFSLSSLEWIPVMPPSMRKTEAETMSPRGLLTIIPPLPVTDMYQVTMCYAYWKGNK